MVIITETRKMVEEMETSHSNGNARSKGIMFTKIKQEYAKAKKNFDKLMEEAKVYETIDQMVKYLIANPILLGICVLVAAVLAVPLLIFIIFAVINVAFAFTGFVVIEVAVLTIGATILCCTLFCIITTMAAAGLGCVFVWFVSCYILSLLRNFKTAGV